MCVCALNFVLMVCTTVSLKHCLYLGVISSFTTSGSEVPDSDFDLQSSLNPLRMARLCLEVGCPDVS